MAPGRRRRAIRADAFPAVRIRSRYVVPAAALRDLVEEAVRTGGCIDLATRVRTVRAAEVPREYGDSPGPRTG
jgi:hypothetical protein